MTGCADKDHSPCYERRSWRLRRARRHLNLERVPVGFAFGRRHISAFFDETGELGIRDVMRIHPETVHINLVRGLLICLRLLGIAAHQKLAARYPHHALGTLYTVAHNHCHRHRGIGRCALVGTGIKALRCIPASSNAQHEA